MVLIVQDYDTSSSTISQVRTRGASHLGLPFGANLLEDKSGAKKYKLGKKTKLLFLHAIS